MSVFPSAADKNPELRYKRTCYAHEVYPKIIREDGSPGCRRCEGPLPPRKRTMCSDKCVSDMLIRCNYSQAAGWLWLRDRGICVACKADTTKLREKGGRRQWEINHKVPVAEGGSHVGLSGLETLCLSCHKKHTAALAARLAEKRKQDKDVQ